MSTSMSLGELKLATRQRADMENQSGVYTNAFIKDPELTSYINQSAFELYDLLITSYGENYYVATPYIFTTDGSSFFYDLPDDFYKLLGVDVQTTSNGNQTWTSLRPFNFTERNDFAIPNTQMAYNLTNLRYRINGDQLWLQPLAQASQTVRLFYAPTMTTLSLDEDLVKGVSGWTEYIIVDAAIKCLQKEESSTTVLERQKQALISRINASAENRDAGNSGTVANVRFQNNLGVFGNQYGWF
jgi:hypothetical protein